MLFLSQNLRKGGFPGLSPEILLFLFLSEKLKYPAAFTRWAAVK
jgi:hypothetical protein